MAHTLPNTDSHPWRADLFRQLSRLARLHENWDGYGSRRIQRTAIRRAGDLLEDLATYDLPAPQLFPVPGGGIQLELKNSRCGIEIEILPDGLIEYLIIDEQGQMREGSLSPGSDIDLSRLVNWFVREQSSVVLL